MINEFKKIQGKTVESVKVKDDWHTEALITFTDGSSIEVKYTDDPWGGSSWLNVEFKETDYVNVH